MAEIPQITLNNGQQIPQFGFGVFLVPPDETVAAVTSALEAGYRHIDTAQMYGNEAQVGDAIARSGLDRGSLYVTTKLANDAHRPDDARRAFDQSLKALGFEYVDLFLIHWPLPTRYDGDFVSTWDALEAIYNDGLARSIGVSNFEIGHLRQLQLETALTPAVNQIEVNPYLTQDALRAVLCRVPDRRRGLVPDRPRGRTHRSGDHRDRAAGRQVRVAGDPALAHPAR